jgi:hypothetical protein
LTANDINSTNQINPFVRDMKIVKDTWFSTTLLLPLNGLFLWKFVLTLVFLHVL